MFNLLRKELAISANVNILNLVRKNLYGRKDLYFAGEASGIVPQSRHIYDLHCFYLSPMVQVLDTAALNDFTAKKLAKLYEITSAEIVSPDVQMRLKRVARYHDDGTLQMPDFYFDQNVRLGPLLNAREGAQDTRVLVERTQVQIYPDPELAKVMFELGMAHDGLLRVEPYDLLWIHETHTLSREILEALRTKKVVKSGVPSLPSGR